VRARKRGTRPTAPQNSPPTIGGLELRDLSRRFSSGYNLSRTHTYRQYTSQSGGSTSVGIQTPLCRSPPRWRDLDSTSVLSSTSVAQSEIQPQFYRAQAVRWFNLSWAHQVVQPQLEFKHPCVEVHLGGATSVGDLTSVLSSTSVARPQS